MNPRKALGPILAVLLLIGVALAINYSIHENKQAQIAGQEARALVNVKILTGSEKEHFLEDPALAKVVAAHGMTLTVQKAGHDPVG